MKLHKKRTAAPKENKGSIIELKGVTKIYYPGKIPVTALREIDLSVCQGEYVALSGASGSGKSTLLNLMGLIDTPSSGSLTIDSLEITPQMKDSEMTRIRRDYIGFIFQSFHLIPTLTAAENIEYPLVNLFHDAAQRRSIVEGALEEVGLKEFGRRFPNELSGGQQQRVSIARAFAKQPRMVLADEPTANLDSKTGAEIADLMERYNRRQNTTLIVATHNESLLSRAKRAIVLKDGGLIKDSAQARQSQRSQK